MLPNPIRYIREKIINKGYKADYCEICHQNFSVLQMTQIYTYIFFCIPKLNINQKIKLHSKLKKIHKCKRCERFICLSCGTQRAVIINPEFEQNQKQPGKQHRICDICANEKQLFRTLQSIVIYHIVCVFLYLNENKFYSLNHVIFNSVKANSATLIDNFILFML